MRGRVNLLLQAYRWMFVFRAQNRDLGALRDSNI